MLARALAGNASTMAVALEKPRRVARVVNAASVGANTVRLAAGSPKAVTRLAFVAAATSAVSPCC
jgi:hypothetical protein